MAIHSYQRKKPIPILILFLFLSCCFFSIPSCCYSSSYSSTVTYTILLQGQQLRDWEHLISPNKAFILKFFSPGKSRSRYLGIYCQFCDDIPNYENKAVWVANRNTPIPDASGNLMIDADGLKISYDGGNMISLSSVPAEANASGTLLDSGNFVLRELNSDGSIKRVLWQSFDYPTDTLLPGMKLGINFETGHKWSLTSWMSNDVPASGSFTFEGDPNGTSQLVILWRRNIYWTTGPWRKSNRQFENLYVYEDIGFFDYISNDAEKYFTYSWKQNLTGHFYRIHPDGYVDLEDLEGREWEKFAHCFSSSKYSYGIPGCVEYEIPKCRKPYDNFHSTRGSIYAADAYRFDESLNFTRTDCRKICLNNCSCTAYAPTTDNGTGCEIFGPKQSFEEGNGFSSRDFYLLISEKEKGRLWIWLIIGLGSLAMVILCFSCWLVRRKLRVRGKAKRYQKMLLHGLGDNTNGKKDGKMSQELQLFSLESISAATINFSETNKLGEGGFGPVFKGKLLDGREVAVKRLSRSSGQGLVEFKNEIQLIAKLQHTNLVRLLGCCIEGEEKVLVYEYMPNKSLDSFLFDRSRKESLKWTERFSIIEGIAQGLLYLHKYSRLRIIHRDLKASNILLDDHLNPKISDFGMAKIFGIHEAEANTSRVAGTYGYMSPEYAIRGIVSTKTDVFSFGVLLLEIVSGKKNNSCYDLEHPLNLIGLVWEMWKEGRALELMDPRLEDSCSRNEVMRCIHLGLLCVQDHAADRPSMSNVVSMLTNENMQLPKPKQPAFFIERHELEAASATDGHLGTVSIDKLSITVVEAR